DRRSGHADGPYKKIANLGSAEEKRRYIRDHRQELGSISKACQVAGFAPSSYYYKPNQKRRRQREANDEQLRQQIEGIQEELPSWSSAPAGSLAGRFTSESIPRSVSLP